MATDIKELKAIDEGLIKTGERIDAPFDATFILTWNRLIAQQPDAMRDLLRQMYFTVLEHYQEHGLAMQLSILNRAYNAKLYRIADKNHVQMDIILRAALVAIKYPIATFRAPTGGRFLLPAGVEGLHWAIMVRNYHIEKGEYEGPPAEVEPLNDLEDIKYGKARGPAFRGKSLERALSPFE